MKTKTLVILIMLLGAVFFAGTCIVDKAFSVEGAFFFGLCAVLSGFILVVEKIKRK